MSELLKFNESSSIKDVSSFFRDTKITNDEEAIQAGEKALALFVRIEEGENYLEFIYDHLLALIMVYQGNQKKIVVSGVRILKYLMESHNEEPSDLKDVAPRTVICEILADKRKLKKEQIDRLAKRYRVDPSIFLGEDKY